MVTAAEVAPQTQATQRPALVPGRPSTEARACQLAGSQPDPVLAALLDGLAGLAAPFSSGICFLSMWRGPASSSATAPTMRFQAGSDSWGSDTCTTPAGQEGPSQGGTGSSLSQEPVLELSQAPAFLSSQDNPKRW